MVYVHGESFEWGTGNIYDGSVLASAGHVIMITLNYRLGILGKVIMFVNFELTKKIIIMFFHASGFLRTRPFADSNVGSGGNLALKDIAMALAWVRENIAAFGGDPTRVTLIGHDTGAALVNLLLLAPYGKGTTIHVTLQSSYYYYYIDPHKNYNIISRDAYLALVQLHSTLRG